MVEAFTDIYLVQADVDDWGFPPKGWRFDAIPVFFALGKDGKATGERIDGNAWQDNTPENMAPPLKRFFESLRK